MGLSTTSDISELRAENLSYEINDKLIINNLSLAVRSGEVLFIEGGNGSGKTTLLRILCGLMQADEGEIKWNGVAIDENRFEYNQQLTFIGHETGVKAELSTSENIKFFSAISGLAAKEQINNALDWVGLKAHEESPGRHLSYGQQRRIALTRLLMDPASLWILDEPFAGLDKNMIASLQSHFTEHVKQGGLLIMTSHQHIEFDGVDTVRVQLGH